MPLCVPGVEEEVEEAHLDVEKSVALSLLKISCLEVCERHVLFVTSDTHSLTCLASS